MLHQLGTAIRDLDPVEGDSDQRRWANGIRVAAPIAGGVQLVGLVLIGTVLARFAVLHLVGLLVVAVVGVMAVVLLHRVNRAGWLASPDPGDAPPNPRRPAPRRGDRAVVAQRRKGTSRSSRPRSLSSARSGISSSIQPLCLMPQNDAWSGP